MSDQGNACTLTVSGTIFDFDGTLFESMGIWENLVVDFLVRQGIQPKPNLREVTRPLSLTEVAQHYIDEYGLNFTVREIESLAMEMIAHAYEHEVQPKPGVPALLKSMHDQGIRMAVATASPHESIEAALERCGLRGYFDAILTVPEVGIGKSSPEIYELAQMRLGTPRSSTWVFEDAAHAVASARSAGFQVCAVREWSAEGQIDEVKANATVFVDSLEQVRVVRDRTPRDYRRLKSVVTIAGSDCSGGAGIQADLKAMAAHRVYGQSVITALTAQNTQGVHGVLSIEPAFVQAQIDAVFTDIVPHAVKIGMVDNIEIIEAIADSLARYGATNVVVDPVMVATSGGKLMKDNAAQAIVDRLFPLAAVVTPNLSEAEALCGFEVTSREDMERAARHIAQFTRGAVLIKGGHLDETADDLVWYENRPIWLSGERYDNDNTHGTGCTLSTTIACELAQGVDVVDAIRAAKNYVAGAILAGLDLGQGHGPLDHMYQYRS